MRCWQTWCWLGLMALLSVGCSPSPPPGFHLARTVEDMGELDSGPTHTLSFPFTVTKEEVTVEQLLPSCGCLRPRLLVAGVEHPLGVPLAPGTKGQLQVDFATAGFKGRKFTGLDILGRGPGLPAKIEVRSWLRSWFEVEPQALQFGAVSGEQEERRRVVVKGREPFRLTGLLGGAPPLTVAGIPSAKAAMTQEFEVVLPPSTAEGRHVGILNVASDHADYTFPLAVEYTIAGRLWTIPDRRILLGELKQGEAVVTTIEIGAREGQLDPPEVLLEGLPGAESQLESLVEGRRYRVQLKVVPDALGTLSGEVLLRLPYHWAGQDSVEERRLQLFAVVRKPDQS